MDNRESYVIVDKASLLDKVNQMKTDGYVLSQISATKKDDFDILYSFEKEYDLVNLRVALSASDEIESINKIYKYAYLYENELKDLFGVRIVNLDIDFKGNLYHTSIKTPYNQESKTIEGES